MTMYWFELILILLIIVICDYWFYKKMKKHLFYTWFIRLSIVPAILFTLTFLYIRFGFKYNHNYKIASDLQWTFFFFGLIYIPKMIYITFYYINKLYNALFGVHSYVMRRIGYAVSIIIVLIMGYGNIVTRDQVQLVKQNIEVENLPSTFNNFKIAVFADMHIGNWHNRYQLIENIIPIINNEKPDIIVFAGDMVNNFADELDGWSPYFKQLKSKSGNFAVLGNHDYGDYTNWKTTKKKEDNLHEIKQHIRELGFRLLLNEHVYLVKGNDSIVLMGVENWSGLDKHRYGDLSQAQQGTNPMMNKILISHDPMHWDAEVIGKKDIFLTIAGHTHGGQIGIVNKRLKISPAQLIFKQWEGLYKKGEQYLYVNRGIGYVGIPLRVGVRPEITILTLKETTPNP